jgi:hypothetical protein
VLPEATSRYLATLPLSTTGLAEPPNPRAPEPPAIRQYDHPTDSTTPTSLLLNAGFGGRLSKVL